ncbi:MAG TPA: hypothetical protein VFN38_15540, partial [Gemmatimonadaceae bacterium]|nr:hypothetical protein [Gemmatimonadaceae bacterium]
MTSIAEASASRLVATAVALGATVRLAFLRRLAVRFIGVALAASLALRLLRLGLLGRLRRALCLRLGLLARLRLRLRRRRTRLGLLLPLRLALLGLGRRRG